MMAHFGRPYGTCRQNMPTNPLPSSELLGYCHTSLRDKNVGNDEPGTRGRALPSLPMQHSP